MVIQALQIEHRLNLTGSAILREPAEVTSRGDIICNTRFCELVLCFGETLPFRSFLVSCFVYGQRVTIHLLKCRLGTYETFVELSSSVTSSAQHKERCYLLSLHLDGQNLPYSTVGMGNWLYEEICGFLSYNIQFLA